MERFEANWDSLRRYEIPAWYKEGKFGIFIHWGPYCVPAFGNEWYPRNMYIEGSPEFEHHVATYGPHTEFGYKDFLPMFKAEQYDPAAWADLFKAAGARFVVPVAEHHDGFPMYASALTRWNAAEMGPKCDVVGELAAAVRAQGMVFGVSSHRAEHWWFMNGGRLFPSDVQDPAYADFYGPAVVTESEERHRYDMKPAPDKAFLDDWLARTCELVDKYQPQLIWFDWWIGHPAFEPYLQEFAAYYYNAGLDWGRGVAINYKYECYPEGTAVLDLERGQLNYIRDELWQNDTSVSKNSWGYIQNHDYKATEWLVQDLVDVVSKNGALLLNVGPRPDGTIPAQEQEMLRAIGRWLDVNGEAIYDSQPWEVFGEGPTVVPEGAFTDTKRTAFTAADFRFTAKGDTLYAVCLGRPEGTATIRTLAGQPVASVRLLGHDGPLAFRHGDNGLEIEMPPNLPNDYAYTFKIQTQS